MTMDNRWILIMMVQSWIERNFDSTTEIDGFIKHSDKSKLIRLTKKLVNNQFKANLSLSNDDITPELISYLEKVTISDKLVTNPQFVIALKSLLVYNGYDTMNLSFEYDLVLKDLILQLKIDKGLEQNHDVNRDVWIALL